MSDDRSLERAARSWLEDGPTRAPDRAIDAALLRIDTTAQERDIRVPWRYRSMSLSFRLIAIAIAITVVGVGAGAFLVQRQLGVIGGPPSSQSGVPASPHSDPSALPSASGLVAPNRTFTSTRHGYRIGLPSHWTFIRATAPWPVGREAAPPPDPMLDVLHDPAQPGLTFVVVSQPLAQGQTPTSWLSAYEASVPDMPAVCWPLPSGMERLTIDGQAAWLHGGVTGCGFTEAVTFADGRIYEFTGYVGRTAPPMSRQLFDLLIASVILDPASADDGPPEASASAEATG
jgi:hypothetical protein